MDKKTEQAINTIVHTANETALTMERYEAAEFYAGIADWAYAMSEEMSMDNEIEMQIYDDEN